MVWISILSKELCVNAAGLRVVITGVLELPKFAPFCNEFGRLL